jgi:hypothetical protein
MMNDFRVRTSLPELIEHFGNKKNGTLRIHLCAEGEVLGTACVSLYQLVTIAEDGEGSSCDVFQGKVVQNEYVMKPRSSALAEEGGEGEVQLACYPPRIDVRLCIDRCPAIGSQALIGNQLHSTTAAVYSSTISQTSEAAASSPTPEREDSNQSKLLEQREKQLIAREAELSEQEREMREAAASLEHKRCEWEQWRLRHELEWHEKLRNKAAAMMNLVEERVCTLEKERLGSVDASKNEYDKLESRLRKTLIEVEAKERQLKDVERGHQNEHRRKLAELESREKLLKEELKHSIEIERAKVKAAIEQAVAANKRAKQIEAEMDQLREQHRKTPEVTLMHQMAELKGQLADSQRRIEAIKAEKNKVTAEKEQFRSNVHKLVRIYLFVA